MKKDLEERSVRLKYILGLGNLSCTFSAVAIAAELSDLQERVLSYIDTSCRQVLSQPYVLSVYDTIIMCYYCITFILQIL